MTHDPSTPPEGEDPRVQAIRDMFSASDREYLQRRKERDLQFIRDHGPQAYLEYLRRGRD